MVEEAQGMERSMLYGLPDSNRTILNAKKLPLVPGVCVAAERKTGKLNLDVG
jgi:hypothetical protein